MAAIVLMIKPQWFSRYGIALAVVSIAAMRISGGMPTGLGILDRLLSPKPVLTALRVALVLLSIGAGYMTFRVGDLGAKAVWQGRIQAADTGNY